MKDLPERSWQALLALDDRPTRESGSNTLIDVLYARIDELMPLVRGAALPEMQHDKTYCIRVPEGFTPYVEYFTNDYRFIACSWPAERHPSTTYGKPLAEGGSA